ncbi:MAG: hypothetical protein L0G96_18950, partial [Acinetobacter sp.]|nr:hypothetical protein [Acinetobacter sp.]
ELFAFVAQNAKSRPFVRQKLKEVIGYIRQWFRDRGFDKFLSRYNDTDLMMFIAEARKAVVDQSYFGKFEDQNISTKQDSNIPQYSRSKNENNKTDNIESLDAWKEFAKNQGISISAHESGDLITLNKIVVPTAERNSGIGSRIMQALVDYADSHKKHIALSPSSDFGGNTAKLKSFYKRFGFIENKGGNKVYQTSETMYREVDGKTLFSRSSSETKNNTSVKQVREVLVQRFGGDVIESLEKQGKLNIRQSYNIEGVEGFYQNGRITLIADNLNDDSIVPTFLHELGGHGGFQNLMSKAKYAELMRMFDEMVKRGDPIALAAKELAERESGTERQQLEYLPYLLTLASTMQQKNALQRNFLQRFISQVVSAVKAWAFDRLGININLNHNDMVALAERMISSSQKYRIQKAKGKDLNRSNENHINADFSMASVWTGLSQDGDAFQLPVSKKTEFTELANALNSDLIVEEIPTRNSDSRYDKLFQVYLPNKKIVMVIQKGREVWINASQLKEGSRGKEIYNLVANYAHNNELVFIGDPVGLSDRAMTRRLENMLSSALKFGTTKHLAPHANQVKGNAVVKPLDWIVGDHIHNVEQMMFASYEAVATVYPEIKNIKYNAEKDIFEGVATGRIKENSQESIREFTRDDFEKLAKNARQSPLKLSSEYAPTSGSTTLERAVLTQTFIKGTAQDRLDIKERLQRIGSNRLTMDNAVLFSRRTKSNSGSTTQQVRDVLIDRFGKETIDELERQGKLEIIQDYQVEGVEGFYYNGKAVLVASNLTAESTVPTFLHELGGHAGFQNMMNQKQYNELMNQFNKLVEQGNPVALAAKMLAEREQGSERQQLEYLPYLLTLSSTMQQRNVIQRNALQKLINNIVSYVKAWVFDNFGINLNLNPDDMLALSERMIGQIKHQSSLDLIRQKYHGTNQWMTAPNGAKTHLSEQQWLQVRTPEFKKWFGDWENDAANASQVLDENGEPKVVYHGTATEFNEFKQGHGLLGDGIYLTDSFDTADV